jgi:hypothetical protein
MRRLVIHCGAQPLAIFSQLAVSDLSTAGERGRQTSE